MTIKCYRPYSNACAAMRSGDWDESQKAIFVNVDGPRETWTVAFADKEDLPPGTWVESSRAEIRQVSQELKQDASDAGRSAFEADGRLSHNPHARAMPTLRRAWFDGFLTARASWRVATLPQIGPNLARGPWGQIVRAR
tara:strand:- start:264 stop:680 length:417 start_codon:yes stop_codon:yes gene_type:complete